MAKIYEIENRLLLPNWRDFKRTVLIGELGSNVTPKNIVVDNSQIKRDWENSRNIGIAADLIGNSFISNDLKSKELEDAISFVEANINDASNPLLSLIKKIKSEINPNIEDTKAILEKNVQSIEEFNSITNKDLFHKIIAKTKNLTKNYAVNAIYWVELARLYTIKNQDDKANKCITIALNLAPDNRFVLRSSVRFFIHTKQAEKAIFYLKKSTSIKSDPWLISAHIASSRVLDRFSPFVKSGINMVNSNNFSNFDLTELSSSLGTLELENGTFKKAKSFIDLSILNPNDNSIAQFEWISKRENRFTLKPDLFEKVINHPFEALAYENFQKGKFVEAFYNCINWYLDFPYSKRPLMFGSYIAVLMGDYNAAIILCETGLSLDKNELVFINNIVYALCLLNNLPPSEKYVKQITSSPLHNLSNEVKVMLQATLGLFGIRSGNIEEGKQLYKLAMSNAKAIDGEFYYNIALINYTRELFLLKDPDFKEYFQMFQKIESVDKDIQLQKSIVSKVINKGINI